MKSCNANVPGSVYMPVVPIVINDQYKSRVLLDTGSTNTFITRNVVKKLGLIGEQITRKLCTLSNVDDNLSEIVDINLTLSCE